MMGTISVFEDSQSLKVISDGILVLPNEAPSVSSQTKQLCSFFEFIVVMFLLIGLQNLKSPSVLPDRLMIVPAFNVDQAHCSHDIC